MRQPLEGVRVLELGNVLAGPFEGMNAAVVKVIALSCLTERINGMDVLARTSSLGDASTVLGEEVMRRRRIVEIAPIPPID